MSGVDSRTVTGAESDTHFLGSPGTTAGQGMERCWALCVELKGNRAESERKSFVGGARKGTGWHGCNEPFVGRPKIGAGRGWD